MNWDEMIIRFYHLYYYGTIEEITEIVNKMKDYLKGNKNVQSKT